MHRIKTFKLYIEQKKKNLIDESLCVRPSNDVSTQVSSVQKVPQRCINVEKKFVCVLISKLKCKYVNLKDFYDVNFTSLKRHERSHLNGGSSSAKAFERHELKFTHCRAGFTYLSMESFYLSYHA
jgi:hypothetical protein